MKLDIWLFAHHSAKDCRNVELQTLRADIDGVGLAVAGRDDLLVLSDCFTSSLLGVELAEKSFGTIVLILKGFFLTRENHRKVPLYLEYHVICPDIRLVGDGDVLCQLADGVGGDIPDAGDLSQLGLCSSLVSRLLLGRPAPAVSPGGGVVVVLVRLVVVHVVRSVEVISFTVGLSSVTEYSLGSVLDEGLVRVRPRGPFTHYGSSQGKTSPDADEAGSEANGGRTKEMLSLSSEEQQGEQGSQME